MLGLRRPTWLTPALLLIAGCAHPQTMAESPGPAPVPVNPTAIPAQKLEGGAAMLTPEGSASGVVGPVKAKCLVSLRGLLYDCRLPDGLPESQERAIWLELEQWRFSPARWNGIPIAARHDLDVPLAPPPPGWSLPDMPPQLHLRATSFAVRPKNGSPGAAAQMAPPQLISGPMSPDYPRAARQRGIEGRVVVRCTLTVVGTAVDCDVLLSTPYLDQAVLALLAAQRYLPAMFEGKPQSIFYTFTFNFRLPR